MDKKIDFQIEKLKDNWNEITNIVTGLQKRIEECENKHIYDSHKYMNVATKHKNNHPK